MHETRRGGSARRGWKASQHLSESWLGLSVRFRFAFLCFALLPINRILDTLVGRQRGVWDFA